MTLRLVPVACSTLLSDLVFFDRGYPSVIAERLWFGFPSACTSIADASVIRNVERLVL